MTTLTLSTHGRAFLTLRPELCPTLGPIVAQILADLASDGIPVECEEKTQFHPMESGAP